MKLKCMISFLASFISENKLSSLLKGRFENSLIAEVRSFLSKMRTGCKFDFIYAKRFFIEFSIEG